MCECTLFYLQIGSGKMRLHRYQTKGRLFVAPGRSGFSEKRFGPNANQRTIQLLENICKRKHIRIIAFPTQNNNYRFGALLTHLAKIIAIVFERSKSTEFHQ